MSTRRPSSKATQRRPSNAKSRRWSSKGGAAASATADDNDAAAALLSLPKQRPGIEDGSRKRLTISGIPSSNTSLSSSSSSSEEDETCVGGKGDVNDIDDDNDNDDDDNDDDSVEVAPKAQGGAATAKRRKVAESGFAMEIQEMAGTARGGRKTGLTKAQQDSLKLETLKLSKSNLASWRLIQMQSHTFSLPFRTQSSGGPQERSRPSTQGEGPGHCKQGQGDRVSESAERQAHEEGHRP